MQEYGILQILSTFIGINSIVPNYIMAISIALSQILLIIYFLANIEENVFNIKLATYATVFLMLLVAILVVPSAVSSKLMRMLMVIGVAFEGVILSFYGDKRIKLISTVILGLITLIGFVGMVL